MIHPLDGPFGVRAEGLDLRTFDAPLIRELVDLLYKHRIVVIPGQDLTVEQFDRFGRQWGEPVGFANAHRTLPGFPNVLGLSNSPDRAPGERDDALHWHSDGTYNPQPSAVTMLYGVEAPKTAGETLFTDMVAAYAALPVATKARLKGLHATHFVFGGKPLAGENIPQTSITDADRARMKVVVHPLVIRHPGSGATALYGVSGTATGIEGMAQDEADALLLELKLHAVRPRFRNQCKVGPGDLLLWDNFSVMHSATPITYSAEDGMRRLLYRISTRGLPAVVQGDAALAAA